ncbi:MAG: SUKH-3 domain-containing protein [Chloroflexota bacterium]
MFSFSEPAQIVLKRMGWYPNRKVRTRRWLNSLEKNGFSIPQVAIPILENLGGLKTWGVTRLIYHQKSYILRDGTKIRFALYPDFHFVPTKSEIYDYGLVELVEKNLLIQSKNWEICPIGGYMENEHDLFVVSNGSIFEFNRTYDMDYDEEQIGLSFLGESIEEAVDKLVARMIAYV